MRSLIAGAPRGRDANPPPYPPARRADLVETHHGVAVADPYRWLEDPAGEETRAWIGAQNELTRSLLDGPLREALVGELAGLYDYARTSIPTKRGGRYFFTHNTGLQNQPVLYVLDAAGAPPRVLLDPNALSPDGTVALTAVAVSERGAHVAYGLSRSGSDWQVLRVLDAATGRDLPDRLEWLKFTAIAWTRDEAGFYYTRFPRPGSVPPGDENYFSSVWYHRLGDPQQRDTPIVERPGERETVFRVDVTDDDRWVVVTAYKGSSDRSEVHLLDRAAPGAPARPLFTGFEFAFTFVGDADGRLFFITDAGARRGRVIALDPLAAVPGPDEIVAETEDKLHAAAIVWRTLITAHLHHASDRLTMWDLDGRPQGAIPLPDIGSVSGLSGRPEDDELFVGFSSFTHAPAGLRYDFRSKQLGQFNPALPSSPTRRPGARTIRPGAYETRQVWFESGDGTRVSMFLVHRRGQTMDGRRPVLLTGYGGFNIDMTPAFDPATFVHLDRGGVFAVAQLRGGGEYGEAWHEAGMFDRKQNVFDDFIAAAEWLIASGVTNARALAIEGGSNGGLLTAAVMLQRPDLFGAVVCRVPVADMLRYHLFTVGRFWVSEYGSAEDPAQFPYLYRYSPYHNIRRDAVYPPVLVTTADTDDRVSPGMALKLAARLQAEARGGPFLIRVDTRAGHGAGKPVAKMIEEDADIFSFLFKYLEVS
jgi:prolyl oligopeptidase